MRNKAPSVLLTSTPSYLILFITRKLANWKQQGKIVRFQLTFDSEKINVTLHKSYFSSRRAVLAAQKSLMGKESTHQPAD